MKKILKLFFILLSVAVILIAVFHKQIAKLYYPIKYYGIVVEASRDNDIPVGLLFAVIHTESGFDPMAESSIGARGLMQITEETFEWVKYRKGDTTTEYDDLYDAEKNIQYGGWLIRLLLDEFTTVENAICAYHAGWGSVTSWLKNEDYSSDGVHITKIPYRDTSHYQNKVLTTWERYNALYNFS